MKTITLSIDDATHAKMLRYVVSIEDHLKTICLSCAVQADQQAAAQGVDVMSLPTLAETEAAREQARAKERERVQSIDDAIAAVPEAERAEVKARVYERLLKDVQLAADDRAEVIQVALDRIADERELHKVHAENEAARAEAERLERVRADLAKVLGVEPDQVQSAVAAALAAQK